MQSFLFPQKTGLQPECCQGPDLTTWRFLIIKDQKITTVAYNMLSIRDPPESKGHAQIKSKGTEED